MFGSYLMNLVPAETFRNNLQKNPDLFSFYKPISGVFDEY